MQRNGVVYMTFVMSAFGHNFIAVKVENAILKLNAIAKTRTRAIGNLIITLFFSGIKIMTRFVVCNCSNTTRYVFNNPNKNNQDMINVLKLADILKTIFF